MGGAEITLEIKGLRKKYDRFLLQDIAFCLPRGYIMGLIGPNGAGKTTIIKSIMGLVRPDSGEIRVFGEDAQKNGAAIRSRIGFVQDVPAFYNHLTVEEMKCVVARFYPEWDETAFIKLSRDFAIPIKKKVGKLSRGMMTRFSLSLALSHNARFIIMDEPTLGLDPVSRRELLDMLSDQIQDGNRSILFSSHITTEMERVADFVTFIRNGRIVFSLTGEEIQETWGLVKGGNDLLNEETKQMFEGIRVGEFGFEAITSQKEKVRKKFGDRIIVERATLEEIMVHMEMGNGGSGSRTTSGSGVL